MLGMAGLFKKQMVSKVYSLYRPEIRFMKKCSWENSDSINGEILDEIKIGKLSF